MKCNEYDENDDNDNYDDDVMHEFVAQPLYIST